MGRYKSVLMAAKDAREFPHHVELPVPPAGFGKRLDIISDWLDSRATEGWRSHGRTGPRGHVACYMFRTDEDAGAFRKALECGELGQNTP